MGRRKKLALGIAVTLGIVAISAPIGIALYLAWRQSLGQQQAFVAGLAQDVLRRSEVSIDQTSAIFAALEADGVQDPCSEAGLDVMRKIDLASEQIQVVGFVDGNLLVCSSFGQHDTQLGPPAYLSETGTYIRPAVEFPALPGKKFLVSTHAKTGYSVAIHPALPLDVSVDRAEMSIGVFSSAARRLMVSRGTFRPEWMEVLGQRGAADLVEGDDLVAIRASSKYSISAYAAIPASAVGEGVQRTALVLVPLGVLAGLMLVGTVLYVTRQQFALPAVLRLALRRDEFFLNYQPLVDLKTGKWVGAEALIRWRRPSGDLVRPDLFIATAEDSGLIQRITQKVVELIGRDAAGIFQQHPDFHIAMNLSSADLHAESTVGLLEQLRLQTKAGARNLMVEATERGLVQADLARRVIGALRTRQLLVAIDDFGTGYSSLSQLESLELDYLKIDKSFVDKLGTDSASSHVVFHIIEMAKSLGLKMIAEGVETETQARLLRERGVEYAQGWLFARPMAFADLAAGLRLQRAG